jgi:chloramphenicol 3-O-phosphotransferase
LRLIFIYGWPATGKLTVARALERVSGLRVFHNHMVVDLLLSVFAFGSEPFVELREAMWLAVFAQACASGLPGLIFTFAPERTVRARFVDDVLETVARGGGCVDFVELTCPMDELKRRMERPERREFGKLGSVELFEQLCADGTFEAMAMPKAAVTIDTSVCTPAEAAVRIARELRI